MDWQLVGDVTHYFDRISVAVIQLADEMAVGDWVGFVRDDEMLFEQEVTSMQFEHQAIDVAQAGEEIAVKVDQEVKAGAEVYRKIED